MQGIERGNHEHSDTSRTGRRKMRRIELVEGEKYGHLTAISYSHISDKGFQMWLCECDCEKHTRIIVKAADLVNGHKKSCGCHRYGNHYIHGMANSRLQNIYYKMLERCYKPSCKSYKNYGGRGIKVCDEWRNNFVEFAKWALENGYAEHLTLDRIDNLHGYSPDNCRWATFKQQENNKTTNHFLTYNNESHTLSEWGEITGINQDAIFARLKLGWSVEKTLTTPIKERKAV